jgi:hypothetical protein
VVHKLVGMFSSTPQQFLSAHNAAIRHGRATGDWRPAVKSVVVHHILGPAMYKGIEAIFMAILGRKPDDDEWKEWAAFMLVGPYAGMFIGRTILSFTLDSLLDLNRARFGVDFIPAERGVEVMVDAIGIAKDVMSGDGEGALKKADQVLDTFAPYRYYSEIKENRFDQ